MRMSLAVVWLVSAVVCGFLAPWWSLPFVIANAYAAGRNITDLALATTR